MSMLPLLAERHLRDGQLHPSATALSAHPPLDRRRRLLAPIRPRPTRRGFVQSDSNRFRAGDVGVELHQRTAACAHMPVDNSPRACFAAYAAKDTKSGQVVMRNQDRDRLWELCNWIGWRVDGCRA
jgi:hypothetical protein